MIILLLAAGAAGAVPSVVEAERAFAKLALAKGQWTAFRETAAFDATMFVPDAVEARVWLKDRPDPKVGYTWQPTAAFLSCDGWMAVTTGASQLAGTSGYFTTVWSIGNPDRPVWKWSLDHGDALATARSVPAAPPVRKAACSKPAGEPRWPGLPTPQMQGQGTVGYGASGDRTLQYRWGVAPDKARRFTVALWTGEGFEIVIDDQVAAPKP